MVIIKNILFKVLIGASAAVAVLLVLVSCSDRLDPADHPTLACAGMIFPFFLLANLVMLIIMLVVKWKRAWIPVLGFVLAFPAIRIYYPLHFRSTPPEGSIKVMSYNVASYSYKNVANPLDSIFSYLRQENADIVCLQEDIMPGKATIDRFADLYPYNDTVHINRPTRPIVNALGIHTRFPILRRERIPYKSNANGSVAFFLQIGKDTVIVINNHLETTSINKTDRQHYAEMINGDMNREEAQSETRVLLSKLSAAMGRRARQADAVHRYIEQHSNYPIIVCGDFNDTPISYVRRTIADGLTDCYVESGCGTGISYYPKGYYFRIDQIMCSDHFEPYNCYVDDDISASDHYPIICWLKRDDEQ